MALKDRIRRAVGRSDDRSSISSSSTGKNTGTTTPTNPSDTINPLSKIETAVDNTSSNAPAITLTKTQSRLSKTLTWHSSSSSKSSKKETAKEKKLKNWEKQDAVEWTSPMSQRPGRKDMTCQNTLRAYDFRSAALGDSDGKDRSRSICSGVSPSGSRANSLDEGFRSLNVKRNSSSAVGPGKLSQEISRDGEVGGSPLEHKQALVTVKEG